MEKSKKIFLAALVILVSFSAIWGFNEGFEASEKVTPHQNINKGNVPEVALEKLPSDFQQKIKRPKELPIELDQVVHEVASNKVGNHFSYEESWFGKNGFFLFNVLNATPEIISSEDKENKLEKTTVALSNGAKATYTQGINAEKIYWNEDGLQYLLSYTVKSKKPANKSQFIGLEKMKKIAEKLGK
ncbi:MULTISPECIES: hypothetical protein [Allobacillus]|uniref:DUF4367 domain-containing protein n=1 Tax=Allobacillus salarius TaxID=1955272 RepID=A0A556PPB6_9BACI|nr:hypothetical protein [Allobacillus salarius]TSJ66223.1 hypothetical protein FPQ13_04960 [Allobacillus salarius]